MRAFGAVVALGVVGACADPVAPTCTDATCAVSCAEAAHDQRTAVSDTDVVYLDAYEAERLGELLPQIGRGVLPDGDPALRLCAGAGPCWGEPPLDNALPLPAGPYALALRVVVPPRGSWKLEITGECAGGPLPSVEVDLSASRGQAVTLDPAATYDIPVDADLCHFRAFARPGESFMRETKLQIVPEPRSEKRPTYDPLR